MEYNEVLKRLDTATQDLAALHRYVTDLERENKRLAPDVEPAGTRPVLVTTAHRGVFFGYAADTTGDTITLQGCRLVVYWSQAMKGFMGLASTGPDADCRIGAPAEITLRNITAVVEVTDEAARNFEAAPWKA